MVEVVPFIRKAALHLECQPYFRVQVAHEGLRDRVQEFLRVHEVVLFARHYLEVALSYHSWQVAILLRVSFVRQNLILPLKRLLSLFYQGTLFLLSSTSLGIALESKAEPLS